MTNFYIQPKGLRAPTNLGNLGYSLSNQSDSFLASTEDSWDTVKGLANSTIGYMYAGHLDDKNSAPPVTQEYVNKYKEQYAVDIDFRENETPSQFELRLNDKIRDNLRQTRINRQYSAANMVGSFAGELANPINYMPGIGVAAKIRSGAGGLAKTTIAINKGKKLSAAFESVKDTAVYSGLGNAAVEPLYIREAQLFNKQYSVLDSIANIGLGTAIGTGLFGPINAYLAFGKAAKNVRSIQSFEEMYSFMETGEFGKAASVLYKNNPEFRSQVSKSKLFVDEVETALQGDGVIAFENLTPEKARKLKSMMEVHFDEGVKNALNKVMTDEVIKETKADTTAPITKFLAKHRNDYVRLYAAIKTNTVNKLSPRLKAIADKVMEGIEGLKGSSFKEQLGLRLNNKDAQLGAVNFFKSSFTRIKSGSSTFDSPPYVDRINRDFIPDDPDLTKSRDAIRSSRTKGFIEDLKVLLPVEETNNSRYDVDSLLNVLMTRVDATNKDVDPDSTVLISFGEYKATIDEVFGTFKLSAKDIRTMYNLVKDLYRDELTQPGALNNFELKREVAKQGVDKKQDILYNHYSDKIIEVVSNAAKKKKILDAVNELPKSKRMKYLRTLLDGQDRKDMTANAGLEVEIITGSQNAAVPLFDVLAEYDLLELFLADSSFGIFKAFRDRADFQRWQMFGKNQKKASKEFHRQLHNAMLDRKLPKAWEKHEALKQLFKVLMATELRVLKDLNAAGLKVDIAKDFGGISQKWDSEIVYRMGKDAFKKRMREVVDVAETQNRVGPKMYIDGKEVDFDFELFLEQWYNSLDPAKRGGDNDPQFDLNNTFQSRNIVVKREFATDVAIEFSGYDSIGHLIFQQIQRRAGLAIMAKFAGTKPASMLKEIASEVEGGSKADRLWFDKTVDGMTGILDNAVDVDIHAITKNVKQASDILFLSGAGISSLTDIPNAISTLEMLGVSFREQNANFWLAYMDGVERRLERDPREMRRYYMGLGAGFDVLNNAVVRRLTDTRTGGGSLVDKLHNLVFKVNGVNASTTILQEMFVDVLTQAMPTLKNNSDLIRSLEEFGFNKTEINQLGSKTTVTPDGVERLDFYALNPKTLQKFRNFVTKYMRQGVMNPDVGTRVQTRLGLRSGTKLGAMVEIATQYQSFMLGMSKTIYRRFANGLNGTTGNRAMMQKMSHLASFLAGALAFGYLATVMKDLAQGKQPILFANMTNYQFMRIVRQSGILGVLETPINMAQYGPMEALAPLPDTLLGVPIDIATGDLQGLSKGVGDLTGDNIYGPPQWLHGMIGQNTAEFLNHIQNDLLDDSQR